jgi:hypothetical protein
MKDRYLEVTFRKGKILAAYLYLPRPAGARSARTETVGLGLVGDFDGQGNLLGLELTAPREVSLPAINAVLRKAGSLELEAAELMVLRAAAAYDRGEETGQVGAYANAAKYCAAEAGFRACETAIMTHGGMGYAREYHVERYFREIQIARIAPVSSQLILSHIAERVLGLPKS